MGSSPKPFQLKVYPNGEFSVHLQRKAAVEPVAHLERTEVQNQTLRAIAAHGVQRVRAYFGKAKPPLPLGLSTPPNLSTAPKRPVRYGLKGMPGRARKMVRNACYLLERDAGRSHLSFLTLTIPSLPIAELQKLHYEWAKVLIAVRKKLTLRLTNADIPFPEVVAVSEIQEKRYERTGYPVLHLHCLFQGRTRGMAWAIDKSEIQQLWAETIESIVGHSVDCSKATRIERVEKSAENYMGKYMSKGVTAVQGVIDDGFADWMPRQWWSMSRTLSQRIRKGIRNSYEFAKTVWYSLLAGEKKLTTWFRDVRIEAVTGEQYLVAFYGKFLSEVNECIESEIATT
uniref:Replication protein n=1 Tax=uncultured prokaryote TaxID=198431 RepID=A0A0H5Q5A2_9ZZZZ|nr:hypothetical protein [uncultured prokaryote]